MFFRLKTFVTILISNKREIRRSDEYDMYSITSIQILTASGKLSSLCKVNKHYHGKTLHLFC